MSGSERRVVVDSRHTTTADLQSAADWLQRGGIVAYPTDTFYGLAADPASAEAVAALFDLKGRDPSTAMPLVAASQAQVEQAFGPLTGRSADLARVFWPGPLSLILTAPSWMAPAVHGGRSTAAIRVPDHVVAQTLAAAFGRPITATSANRSGEPAASDVRALGWLAIDPRVWLIDGGHTPGGVSSTIVDARCGDPVCVRAGAIAWERVLTSR